jgi:hypothetical protein
MILTFILSGDYCSIYETDMDIIKSLPFSINIESKPNGAIDETSVVFDSSGHVTHLYLVQEKMISNSIFCLTHLESLMIEDSNFENGMIILPSEIRRRRSTLTQTESL